MRGHLRKRGERSWSVVVDIGHDLTTGKRRQKWIGVKGTKRDAERKLAEVIRGLDVGSYVEPSRLTLGDYLDQWLADYVETSVRPRTAAGYRGLVGVVQKSLGQVRLTDLSPQAVQRYYAKLLESGLSAHTVLHYHRLLSQALKQAVKWELLPRNVMDRVTPPKKVRPDFKILDMADVERLLTGAAGTDYLVPIHLAVHTGLRRSELCGLRWSDLDLTAGNLTVVRTMVGMRSLGVEFSEPKSRRSRRVVAFGEGTAELLRAHRGLLSARGPVEDMQVCARGDGSVMRPDSLSHGYKKIAEGCGLSGVRFHDLRHTHASLLLASNVPVHVVQARMGHESIQTTVDIYGHVLPASDFEAGRVMEERLANLRLQNVCKKG